MVRLGIALPAGFFTGLAACSAVIGVNELTPGPEQSDAAPSTDASVDGALDDGGTPRDASGKCEGGPCTPVPLTSSEINLEELRVVKDRVLYRAALTVRTVPLAGGLPSTFVPCSNRAGLFVTDAGFYSWCNTLVTLRDIGDAGIIASAVVDGTNAAAGGGSFFFLYATQGLKAFPDTLGDGGFTDVGNIVGGLSSMTTSSSELFVMSNVGTLWHVPLGTTNFTDLEHDQTAPTQIAVDDQGVFWATDGDTDRAVLHARPLGAGASTPIATGLDHPDGTAVDESYVYVTLRGTPPDYANGKIVRVPRSGGAVEPLAQGIVYPHRIAVTKDYVVFTSLGTNTDAGFTGGAIYRLTK